MVPMLALAMAYQPALPADAAEYQPAVYTQAVATVNNRPNLRLVRIDRLTDRRWRRSGGMLGVRSSDYESRKYRSGGRPVYTVKPVPVKNSLGYDQNELGLTRAYPDGARFDDVLRNAAGDVFEHRVREKAGGKWYSRVEYRDMIARPTGYAGLDVSCASCHLEAGTGGYAEGLVPGGDTVLSDPMDWGAVSPGLMRDGP